jgi:hypothetical protein
MLEQWVHKFNDNFIQDMLIAKMAKKKQEIIEMESL